MKKLFSFFVVICLMISSFAFAQTAADRKKADQMTMEGRVLYSEGRHRAAISVLQPAVALNPTNGAAVYYLAMSHIRVDETDQAITVLEAYEKNSGKENVILSSLDKQYIPQNRKLLIYAKTKLK